MFCLIQGLAGHGQPRAKQLIKLLIRQQLLALRSPTEQQTQTLRERILKMTWILS